MPRRIGKYELGRTLGMGTVVSKVKVATNCETGKTLAIKIVDKDAMEIGGMTTRARLKLAPLRVFDHKNIAKVKEFMQTANQNHLYIVQGLAAGGDLSDKVQEAKRFDEATARYYFHQLVEAVRFCHANGVAHRNLCLEKLWLNDDGTTLKLSPIPHEYPSSVNLAETCYHPRSPHFVSPEALKIGRAEFRMTRHFSDDAKDLLSKIIVADPASASPSTRSSSIGGSRSASTLLQKTTLRFEPINQPSWICLFLSLLFRIALILSSWAHSAWWNDWFATTFSFHHTSTHSTTRPQWIRAPWGC